MIELNEWIRMVLLYGHLLLTVIALSQVFETDLRIALGGISISALSEKSARVGSLLFAMWLSGIAVIYMDTGFELLALAADSKLQLKIVCVTFLSLNSLMLHWYSLPAVMKQDNPLAKRRAKRPLSKIKSAFIVYIAALSLSNWMLAAFIGIADPLANLGFFTLFKLYIIVQILVFIVSMISFPYLNKRLMLMKSEYDATQNELDSPAGSMFNEPAYSVIRLGSSEQKSPRRPRR